MTIFFTSIKLSPPKLIIAQEEKGEKMINEKDIDELLNIRKKLSNAEWDFINSVICETLNSRVRNELTDSEIEKISKHLKREFI